MKRAISEIDVVKLLTPIDANVIGQDRIETISLGSLGTVVMVHDNAYEVEFALEIGSAFALATVKPEDIELHWESPK